MDVSQLSLTQKQWRPVRVLHPNDAPGYNDQELVIERLNDAIRDLEARLATIETAVADGTIELVQITLTDKSGAITLGGTAQTLMAANPNRKYLYVQNVSSNLLWINFGSSAVQDEPSIKLMPDSDAFKLDAKSIVTALVSIIGATTGQKFTAKEGT